MAAMLPLPSSLLLHNWLQQYQLELSRAAPPTPTPTSTSTSTAVRGTAKAMSSEAAAEAKMTSPVTPIGSPKASASETQLYQTLLADWLCRQPLFASANQNEPLTETLTHYLAYLLALQAQNAVPSPQAVSPDVSATATAWPLLPQTAATQQSASFVSHRHDQSNSLLKLSRKSKSPDLSSGLPHGIDSILKTESVSNNNSSNCNSNNQATTKDVASTMLESFNALLNIELPKALVLRTSMPSRAAPFLMNGFLHNVSNASNLGLQFGVFCNQSVIERGTRFGPFRGRIRHILSLLSQQRHYLSKKLHQFQHQLVQQHAVEGDCSLLDGASNASPNSNQTTGNFSNWMLFVRCARSLDEANLIAFQNQNATASSSPSSVTCNTASSSAGFSQLEIYYETLVDISRDSELVVWYGDLFLQLVAKLETLQTNSIVAVPSASFASDEHDLLGDRNSAGEKLSSKNGSEAQNSQAEATNGNESFQCERCGKVFAYKYYRDKHLKFTKCVDQGDRKFPCHLCTRSFEKRDRLRIHILHVHEKHRPHKCLVCGKCFSQSSSLNKHLRVHTGDRPYRCLYCGKAFTASSILRTHVRLHSGERPFKCKYCGKAFASHAAHDSHIRRTHSNASRPLDTSNIPEVSKLASVAEEYSDVEIDDEEHTATE